MEHLAKNGTERFVEEARDHMHKIRTLTDFNYFEGAVDKGAGGMWHRCTLTAFLS